MDGKQQQQANTVQVAQEGTTPDFARLDPVHMVLLCLWTLYREV